MKVEERPKLSVAEAAERAERVLAAVEGEVVGKRAALEHVLLALLADGHVLLEDYPGVAKTLIARCFAAATGLDFARVQFTPDLLPADITGSAMLDRRTSGLTFQPGPVFTHVLLGDEINRASPKTQAALLEAMEERQVTADGETRPLSRPFLVIATQNPIEYEGTYPLPEAQLDRFLARVSVGYPDAHAEQELLVRRVRRRREAAVPSAVMGREELLAMQATVETVYVEASVLEYIVAVVDATRRHPSLEIGASPRGSLALLKLSRARALLDGRDFVLPDDVKGLVVPALAHRLVLPPERWLEAGVAEAALHEVLERVPAPPVRPP